MKPRKLSAKYLAADTPPQCLFNIGNGRRGLPANRPIATVINAVAWIEGKIIRGCCWKKSTISSKQQSGQAGNKPAGSIKTQKTKALGGYAAGVGLAEN